MPTYKVPVVLEVAATAYVEARTEQAALELAATGQWESYEQIEISAVRRPGVAEVEALPPGETGYADTVLRQRVDAAHAQADAMSQEVDDLVLPLLDAARVLLGAVGLQREKALAQAIEVCRRGLGDNPPMWAEMRALLGEAVTQLDALYQVTLGLDDGDTADGPDWNAVRGAADDLATRSRALLARLEEPSGVPLVRVDVCGGRATVVCKPYGTAVEVRAFDTEEDDPNACGLQQDDDREPGRWYASDYLGPEDELMG